MSMECSLGYSSSMDIFLNYVEKDCVLADEGSIRFDPRRINAFHTVVILHQHEDVMHNPSLPLFPACC